MIKFGNHSQLINYFKVFLLIIVSGNPVIIRAEWAKSFYVGLGLFCIVLYLFKPSKEFLKNIGSYVFFFLTIFIFQYYNFKWNTLPGILGFIIKCFTGAYLIWSVKDKFIEIYTNILTFISLIGIIFYSLAISNIIPIPNLLPVVDTPFKSIGIFIYNPNDYRNIGMFWEPGAFAGFIILALILNINNLGENFRKEKLKYSILILALLSTFSTTGYIILFLIVLFKNIELLRKRMLVGIPLVIISTIIIFNVYTRTEFLSEKIESQYETSMKLDGRYDPSRLGALLFDLHYIKKNPLTGNGLHERTRFADHPWLQGERAGSGNGFSNFTACMGLLSIIFYFYVLFRYLPFQTKDKFFFLFIILLLLQTEQYLNFSMFLGLPFLHSSLKKDNINLFI